MRNVSPQDSVGVLYRDVGLGKSVVGYTKVVILIWQNVCFALLRRPHRRSIIRIYIWCLYPYYIRSCRLCCDVGLAWLVLDQIPGQTNVCQASRAWICLSVVPSFLDGENHLQKYMKIYLYEISQLFERQRIHTLPPVLRILCWRNRKLRRHQPSGRLCMCVKTYRIILGFLRMCIFVWESHAEMCRSCLFDE